MIPAAQLRHVFDACSHLLVEFETGFYWNVISKAAFRFLISYWVS